MDNIDEANIDRKQTTRTPNNMISLCCDNLVSKISSRLQHCHSMKVEWVCNVLQNLKLATLQTAVRKQGYIKQNLKFSETSIIVSTTKE